MKVVPSWWESVSVEDLALSASRVAGLMDPVRDRPHPPAAALARALALQELLVPGSPLRAALAQAHERTQACRPLAPDAAPAADVDAWLAHCRLLVEVFRGAIDLLGSADAEAMALVDRFEASARAARGDAVAAAVARGLGRDLPTGPPASFRRRPR